MKNNKLVNNLESEIVRLQQIIDGTDIGTWEWNVQTGATRFNERWAQIVGYTLDEISPTNIDTWLNFAHPDDLIESERLLNEHFEGYTSFYHCEIRMRHRNGTWVWVRDHARVVSRNRDGLPEWVVGSHIDITEEKKERIADERLKKIASSVPGMIYEFEMDNEGKMSFPYASPGIVEIYGVTPCEVNENVDKVFLKIHPEDIEFVHKSISHSAETLEPWIADYRVIIDGHTRWLSGYAKPEQTDEGIQWYGLIVDSTEKKEFSMKLVESQRRLKQAQELAHLGHWEANIETGEMFWSPKIFEIYGFDPECFLPSTKALHDAIHPDDRNIVKVDVGQTSFAGIHDVEYRIIRPDGKVRWVHEYVYSTKLNDVNEVQVLIGTIQDITDRKELELRLREQSNTDPLTQIYNRRYAMAFMENKFRSTHQGSSDKVGCTVISFDFDHFKQLNDKYGHAVGDNALKLLSQKVKAVLRSGDVFARMGGEEFLIILPDATLEEGWCLAERVRKVVESIEIVTRSGLTYVTVTLAVAAFSMDDASVEDFYIRLDDGLYKGKREGRNRVVIVGN